MEADYKKLSIVDGKVVDTITGEVLSDYSYFINKYGIIKYRAKRKYVKKHDTDLARVIRLQYRTIIDTGQKKGALYFRVMDYLKEMSIPVDKLILETIANYCGYSNKWVDFKCKELNIK